MPLKHTYKNYLTELTEFLCFSEKVLYTHTDFSKPFIGVENNSVIC